MAFNKRAKHPDRTTDVRKVSHQVNSQQNSALDFAKCLGELIGVEMAKKEKEQSSG